jgi:hypothetical protein
MKMVASQFGKTAAQKYGNFYRTGKFICLSEDGK